MSESFDRVKAVVAAAAQAWDDLVPRLVGARAALEAKIAEASHLDPALVRDLELLRPRFDELATALVTDPLSVAPDSVAALEHDLAALGDVLLAAGDLRADLDDRLERARTLLDSARNAAAQAQAAYKTAIAKVANPAAAAPRELDETLEEELELVTRLVADGHVRDACSRLDKWTARVDTTLTESTGSTMLNGALGEARRRLRGRLDAYLAKAHAVHLAEDADVSELYEAARAVLYTAPTDLEQARKLVERYQRAVSHPMRRLR